MAKLQVCLGLNSPSKMPQTPGTEPEKREEMEENFECAAAIAVFHGHVRRAVFSLRNGAQSTREWSQV